MTSAPNPRKKLLGVAAGLAAATLAVYWPVGGHEFISLDTPAFVTANPRVLAGLTPDSVRWAFTATETGNWHPVTWLSHMLDCELFGPDPGWHHRTNLLFHTVNTALLFLVIQSMTGRLWPSALVAALFGLHPLHVESVAWVAERKDLLCAFFGFLALGGYAWYVRRPGPMRYVAVAFPFALGLLSKPMLVTWPFVLLLLDAWPLGRYLAAQTGTPDGAAGPEKAGETPAQAAWLGPERVRLFGRLVLEKLPLMALTAASVVMTLHAQTSVGAFAPLEVVSFQARLGNALVSYVQYAAQMLWPSQLGVFYPHPREALPLAHVMAAAALLAAATWAAIRLGRKRPYLPVGWFWYLGTLVPVIGLVQVGGQAMADRYTYIPLIGLFVSAAWLLSDLASGSAKARMLLAAGCAAAVLALAAAARVQLSHWKTSESLYEHTIAVTEGNAVAHMNLGNVLIQKGRIEEALKHHEEAVRIRPDSAGARTNLGAVLALLKRDRDAVEHYHRALEISPNYADAHYNLGLSLMNLGNLEEAVTHVLETVRLRPDFPEAWNSLSSARLKQGRPEVALEAALSALERRPGFAEAHLNRGLALARLGKTAEALEAYLEALRLRPDLVQAHVNVGPLLAAQGKVEEAIAHYGRALELKPDSVEAMHNLANLLSAQGKEEEAVRLFERALAVQPGLAEAHYSLGLLAYRQGKKESAVRHFTRAVEARPDFAEARDGLGVALGDIGDTAAAVHQFTEALKHRPDHSSAHNNLGALLFRMGKRSEGIEHYRSAVQADPANADAQYNLGAALHQEGKVNEALEHYEAAVTSRPGHVEARNNLGVALYQLGRAQEAIRQFEETLRYQPDHPGARSNLEKVKAMPRR
ncbi:MAG: tetratricopeptide repeat protein [Planctomycetes bacterium]|nr:tetratricopeptide repeat protein [Planctomycetota bacterium]